MISFGRLSAKPLRRLTAKAAGATPKPELWGFVLLLWGWARFGSKIQLLGAKIQLKLHVKNIVRAKGFGVLWRRNFYPMTCGNRNPISSRKNCTNFYTR